MRRVLFIGALGALAMLARKLLGRGQPDFTDVNAKKPQQATEVMEQAADVPGGVRP